MKKLATILTFGAMLAILSTAHGQGSNRSFSVHASSVSGFPTGEVSVTGGGSFDAGSGFLQARGGFRCAQDVAQGPLAGCRAGEGVRWEGANILPSTTFKCTGADGETLKTATTDASTLVMQAEFYIQGDGVIASFHAKMIVSALDLDPDEPGTQNVWIQGVGCGTAIVNFR